jgi:signal transduction histidine kinase/CheY-like chemotaxis protein
MFLVLLVFCGAAVSIHHLRGLARESAELNAETRAAAIAAHASQVFSTGHYLLDGIVDEVRRASPRSTAEFRKMFSTDPVQRALSLKERSFAAVDVISLFDTQGNLVSYSRAHPAPPINVADREGFRVAQQGLSTPFVTSSVKNRSTAEWTFYMAQRLESSVGEFLGVAMVGLSTEHFSSMFEEVRADHPTGPVWPRNGEAITLVREDLAVLARAPLEDALMGKRLTREGNYQGMPLSSPSSGTPELQEASPWEATLENAPRSVLRMRRAEGVPVYAAVAISEEIYLREWRAQSAVIAAAAAVAALCLASIFFLVTRLLRRQERQLEENRKLRAEAESANRAKSEFLATMSHEVRTPLNGILGTADLLSRTELTEAQANLNRTLVGSGHVLLGLIDDVLDLSKIEAGEFALDPRQFSPRELAVGVMDLFAGLALTKAISLGTEVDPGVPDWVVGDANRIRQVLVNLVSNAVKFCEVGCSISIVVTSERRADEALIRMEVSDTGPGISEEARPRIFMPFSQADGSVARRYGGTGLGLAISQRLVKLMGGTIDFTSVLGKGSCFWFELQLPLAVDGSHGRDADLPAPLAGENRFANAGASPLKQSPLGGHIGKRVLVVEDDAVNAMIVEAQLGLLGCRCDVAHDGEEALARLREHSYDLVLMDCMLPRLSGYDTATKWRGVEAELARARVPIVALTANALSSNADRCRAAGMDDYLTKPCTVEKLDQALKQWLNSDVER